MEQEAGRAASCWLQQEAVKLQLLLVEARVMLNQSNQSGKVVPVGWKLRWVCDADYWKSERRKPKEIKEIKAQEGP